MDNPKIKFGDKIFIYGQYLRLLDDFNDADFNEIIGYLSMNGFTAFPAQNVNQTASLFGFIVDFYGIESSLAVSTPFSQMEMVDVTDILARSLPLPSGTKVWLPTHNGY